MKNVQHIMREKLTEAFAPTCLEIHDDSDRHRGHSGWQEGGETHFRIRISSPGFAAMTRLERHRAVHKALSPDPLERIHALSLDISDR